MGAGLRVQPRRTYCRQNHKDIVRAERLDDDGPGVDSERDENEGEGMEDGQDRDQCCRVALRRPSGIDGCRRWCRHVDRGSPADLPVSRPTLGLLDSIRSRVEAARPSRGTLKICRSEETKLTRGSGRVEEQAGAS